MNFAARCTAALTLALCAASGAHAQVPTLPPPEATDPVRQGIMQGFPPPPEKSVHLANLLKYPNARWGFHHLRELGPTTALWRGAGAPSSLPARAVDLDAVQFDTAGGTKSSLADWQRNTYTDGLLVLHRGQVVYERTYAGMQAQHTHVLWSMSKSLSGLLLTELIQEGTVDPRKPVAFYVPELAGTAWEDATVQQTLDMTTGVRYAENFADPAAGVFQYLIATGLVPPPAGQTAQRSVLAYLRGVKKEGEHGEAFQYKSVDTEVLGWLLQRVTGQSIATLLSQRIWSRIGAQEDGFVWVDPSGAQVASIGVGATLRDLARLGEMLRLQGRFNGQQVVSAAAVAELRRGADPEKFKAANMPMRAGYSYHNHWWIPHDADGSFEAKGLHGQHLHINPAAELVVVKFSSHPVPNTAFTHTLDRQAFAAIAAALRPR